ncbi:MAG: transglutaminase domain-containing protein [Clostridia bacterium]|nr:transglutaminase domain-containing protein [Clostridia bacterium]
MSKKSSAKKRKAAKAKAQAREVLNKPEITKPEAKKTEADPLKKVTDELLDELEKEASGEINSEATETKASLKDNNSSQAETVNEPNSKTSDEPEIEPDDEPEVEPEDEPGDQPSENADISAQSVTSYIPENEKKHPILFYLLALIVVILLPVVNLIAYGLLPHETEIGEEITLPLRDMPFLASKCEIKTDLDVIDTDVIGKHPLELEFFGFIPIRSTLSVRDSTAPTVKTHTLCIPSGTEEVYAEDFIRSTEDKTELTYSIRGKIDYENGGTVKLSVTDEFGNRTNCTAELAITDLLTPPEIELGTKKADLTSELLKHGHLSELDFEAVNFSECGTYRVRGNLDGTPCLFDLTIVDTIAPSAETASFDIFLGQTLEAEDFIKNAYDRSEFKAYFHESPDFENVGWQVVTVILEDEYGNAARFKALLNIHDFKSDYTIEAGTPNEVFVKELPQKSETSNLVPYLPDDVFVNELPIGTHKIELQGEYSKLPISLTVIDTIAPVITLKSVQIYSGTEPDAAVFIDTCEDASEVTFTLGSEIDTSLLGEQVVTVIATDAAGNFTSCSTSMYVIKDTEKPVIHGVKSLVYNLGETVYYRSGVYATDNCDGEVNVTVDASKVNTSVAGIYYVTYQASDSSGNTATVSARVTIGAISRQTVDELADKLLAKIVTDSMTPRQKAEAIYNWCSVNIKYSSATSYLMGNFIQAAYTGFTRYYGNCYTYYAVASALLTRAGIENIEIHRNDPDRPHYWNLVKMDGEWYHFDTCPQPAPHKLKVFLLTDSEVRAFSLDYYYDFDANNYPTTP